MDNKERMKKLTEIIKPIAKFMNEEATPHDILIIQQGRVEFFSGEFSFNLEITD